MKKVWLMILIVLLAILAACSIEEDIQNDTHDAIRLRIEEDRQDLELLIAELESNFPLLGPIYRRHGVDLHDRFLIIHRNMERRTNLDQDRVGVELNNLTDRIWGAGHLSYLSHFMYREMITRYYRWLSEFGDYYSLDALNQYYYDIMRSEAAMRRFGDIEIDLYYFDDMIFPYNVTTRIISEGEIAYISIGMFWHYNFEYDREIIFGFYEQITGFDHLIVDLRGNPGGFPGHFTELIMAPLIDDVLRGSYYEFFMAGSHALLLAEATMGTDFYVEMEPTDTWFPAAAFVKENNMTYFNPCDLEILDYVLPRNFITRPADHRVDFHGQIWLLIDGNSFSAAEMVAIYAKYSGFATLVGTPTGGVPGAMSAFAVLPNSGHIVRFDVGYITNRYGRSVEEFGVEPHYFNRPGMDALETVLALINEG